jgi:hypothetical protein
MRNPQVVENFRKLVTGRKRVYREDGSWFWYNPNKKVANG